MKDELVERARRWTMNTGYDGNPNSVPMVMIDRIESLEAKLEKAREALTSIADADYAGGPNPYDIAAEALKEISQ